MDDTDRAAVRAAVTQGTLAESHRALTHFNGVGSFLAGQIIADLKYVDPLKRATDWWTWACPGPGSMRGLNRVLGLPYKSPWKDSAWLRSLKELHGEIRPRLAAAKMRDMHAQDMQNCLCEFDKYERVRLGQGQPKQRYAGR